jgi:hypothetical protein
MASRKRTTKTQKKVGKVMHEYKHGELHSGSKKGPKVKNPKQAIAIALSEARQSGGDVPPRKGGKKSGAKKSGGKKAAAKKSTAKKSGAKKSGSKKSTTRTRKATKKSSRKSSRKS